MQVTENVHEYFTMVNIKLALCLTM